MMTDPAFTVIPPSQEQKFLAAQKNHLDATLTRIIAENKREISDTERQCLLKKQHLIIGTTARPGQRPLTPTTLSGRTTIA